MLVYLEVHRIKNALLTVFSLNSSCFITYLCHFWMCRDVSNYGPLKNALNFIRYP